MREVDASWTGAVFVCTNQRPPDSDRASCGLARGGELREWLKNRRKERGLKGVILCAKSSCLDVCSPLGVTLAIVPDPASGRRREMVVFPDDGDREALWERVCEVLQANR